VLALEVILAVAVLAGVALVAVGRGDPMAAPDPTPSPLEAGRQLRADDIERVRFRVALRGYRMDEVDLVLERAAAALRELEARPAQPEALAARQLPQADVTEPGPPVDSAAPEPRVESAPAEPPGEAPEPLAGRREQLTPQDQPRPPA
jgi:DivIVA domain-containing protein